MFSLLKFNAALILFLLNPFSSARAETARIVPVWDEKLSFMGRGISVVGSSEAILLACAPSDSGDNFRFAYQNPEHRFFWLGTQFTFAEPKNPDQLAQMLRSFENSVESFRNIFGSTLFMGNPLQYFLNQKEWNWIEQPKFVSPNNFESIKSALAESQYFNMGPNSPLHVTQIPKSWE